MRCVQHLKVRAALAELRLRARRHLAQVAGRRSEFPKSTLPAFLPFAAAVAMATDMERSDYDPFLASPNGSVAAAMAHLARCKVLSGGRRLTTDSAATVGSFSAIELSRSASARLVRALLRASALAVLRPNLLLRSNAGVSTQRWEQAKIYVHRLERGRTRIDRFDVTPGNMREQCAMRGGRWWRYDPLTALFGRGKTPREQTDARRFHIAFAAGDLTGKTPARVRSHSQ